MTGGAGAVTLARRMWRTLEPYHGFVYFAAEATAEYDAIGAPEPAHYFGSRAAAMGAVRAPVVEATFFNFAPARVRAAIPAAWEAAPPEAWVAARVRAVDRTLQRVIPDALGSEQMAEAARLAHDALAATAGDLAGRPLAAAHAALVPPDEPHLALWHAIATLREHRGDGHIALLTAAGLRGIEALVTHAATGEVPAGVLRATRGWSVAEWDGAVEGLRERGIVDGAGGFTPAGRAQRDEIEAETDRLAAAPWAALGEDRGARLRELVRPWSRALVDAGAVGFRRTDPPNDGPTRLETGGSGR